MRPGNRRRTPVRMWISTGVIAVGVMVGWWSLAAPRFLAGDEPAPRRAVGVTAPTNVGVDAVATPDAAPGAVDRSPIDFVMSPNGEWLATANQTSNSVSLVRWSDGRVLDERRVGRRPSGICRSADGERLLVSCRHAGEIHVLRVAGGERLTTERVIAIDGDPQGVVLARNGRTAFVALATLDQVAELDVDAGQVTRRIAVGRWPRTLALAPDETRLAVGTSGDRGMSIVDLTAGKLQAIDRFVGLNIGQLQMSRDGQHVYFPWIVYRRNSITPGNIRLGWVLASRVARLRMDGDARREALSLDPPGKAVADPHGLALTSDEKWLVIAASGTHELLILRAGDLPFKQNGSTDHIESELLADHERFQRVELGGRPMTVRITPDDRQAVVANYLDNSLQVVDLASRKLVRSIPLGSAPEVSLARRGEAIFFDGRRSLDQWYSCHSCHYEGGTSSVVMDTENDGSSFTFKTVLPLYRVAETAPWTWHGWQTDLRAAMRKSLQTTMLGPEPTEEDVDALLAYFRTLEPPPPPKPASDELQAAVERGAQIFASDSAGCANCHSGPHFTDGKIHDVGLGKPSDRYRGFNTPSLRGVGQKVIWLHDGRGIDLKQVLSGPHDPAKVSGTRPLAENELDDLVAYLKTL